MKRRYWILATALLAPFFGLLVFFFFFVNRNRFQVLRLKDMAAYQATDIIYSIAPVEKLGSLVLTTFHREISPILDGAAFAHLNLLLFLVQFELQVPNPYTFAPDSGDPASAFASLPECSGIYALSTAGHPPHISWSINLKRRLTRLLVPSYTAAAKHFSKYTEKISSVSYWPVGSRLESSLILYGLTSRHYPTDYLRRLRLRMPWFISLNHKDAFPRLEVANRLTRLAAPKFGPFLSRDLAQQHEQQLLSLHQLRRCTEALSPGPDHPGCIYGEMNQCLRPCQCVVSAAEYATEAARVQEFLETSGKSALNPLLSARERAAADLDFEQAALLHKRIEKVQAANASRDKVIAPVQSFNGIALTKSSQPGSVCLWPMISGYWQQPVNLPVDFQQSDAKPLDQTLRETLTRAIETPSQDGNRLEHLALFSRWYYSSWRDGQWFPFKTLEGLNYRKLVREIASLIKLA